jgi:DEAD/DEAH box helicase domain-containing protein
MLPSVVSREVISAIQSQLRAQFPSTTTGFSGLDGSNTALIDGLTGKDGNLFKGPYLSFGLPFRTASSDEALPFEHIDLPYAPYAHQFKAFQRLTGPSPLPTLVATGTGSGKTECFMYPILEHCITHPGPGVKAIIVYPMNALAQDQARRFAEEIYSREAMRGSIRVGLFTGDSETTRRKTMTADSVITCKTTQRETPPDILLTNYKMLDYLLIRPRDRALWRFNEPKTMRFLVVDELHTFDGAQGTDLACLIRRLRDRLAIGETLACVGTSATVGEETEALVKYASEVFDQPFTSDSVLREERIDVASFLATPDNKLWPDAGSLAAFAAGEFVDVVLPIQVLVAEHPQEDQHQHKTDENR